MSNYNMQKIAEEILVCTSDRLEKREIPSLDGFYFRNTDRGGGALIVDNNGDMLFVDPFFIDFDEHLKRFKDGERSIFEY